MDPLLKTDQTIDNRDYQTTIPNNERIETRMGNSGLRVDTKGSQNVSDSIVSNLPAYNDTVDSKNIINNKDVVEIVSARQKEGSEQDPY